MHLTPNQLFFILPSPIFSRPAAALVPFPIKAVISSFLCICSLLLILHPFNIPLSTLPFLTGALHITAGELYELFCRSAAQQQSRTWMGCIWTEMETTVQMLMPQCESPRFRAELLKVTADRFHTSSIQSCSPCCQRCLCSHYINTIYSSSNRKK